MNISSRPRLRHVIQGQYCISDQPDEVLSTLLGSCVAACFYDATRRIGGMNHFLLPGSDPNASDNVKYGAHSMEQLVNGLLRGGSRRSDLEVWLFGGANVLSGMTKIGDSNAKFATAFVRDEGFRLRGTDLGGTRGRKVRFHPTTGQAQAEFMRTPVVEEMQAPPKKPTQDVGEIELF